MAFLQAQLEVFNEYWDQHKPRLADNARLLDIYNGNLLPYIKKELKSAFTRDDGTLSPTYDQLTDRIVPINVLERIIDRKSKIYSPGPKREVVGEGATDGDREVLTYYEEGLKITRQLNLVNEQFNLFDYALAEPVAYDGRLFLRAYKNSQFLPWSDDVIDPTNPTVFLIYHGMKKDEKGNETRLLRAYSAKDFAIFNESGEVDTEEMAKYGSDGTNPHGILPFYYFNRKQHSELIPTARTDTYAMTVLVPVLLTDVGFGLKFQAFSLLYGIDVDDAKRPFSPSVMWVFKSPKDREAKPEIGSIKPEIDAQQSVDYVVSVVSLWLSSRGIRPGAVVGELNASNFTSGVSKIIDEMDTSEDRQNQIEFFRPVEEDMLKDTVHTFHPNWQSTGDVDPSIPAFTKTSSVSVSFPEQTPIVNRSQVISDVDKEMELGLEHRRGAMKRLNPDMTEEEIDLKLAEIDAEKAGDNIKDGDDGDNETSKSDDQDR